MYCVNCGVRLADTEEKCPLCNTAVYHPDIQRPPVRPLYPKDSVKAEKKKTHIFNGVLVFLFLIPIFVSLLSDWLYDNRFDWSGYVVGGVLLGYIVFCLPLWFKKPNPVVFTPCNFAALALYLHYINYITEGNWFLGFAFPLLAASCLIVTAVVTLAYYLKKGRLYISGGFFISTGAFALLTELLLDNTFGMRFVGWSIYPLVIFVLLGAVLIYIAISTTAREVMERKLFF